jgi:hypothetical protein
MPIGVRHSWVLGIRQQAYDGCPAEVGRGDTEVEDNSTDGQVQSPAGRVRVAQATLGYGAYLQRDGLRVEPEAPRLGVVGRGRGHGGRDAGFQGRGVERRGSHDGLPPYDVGQVRMSYERGSTTAER